MQNVSETAIEAEFSPTDRQRVLAWATHLFTASGFIWGMFSVIAIADGQWLRAFGWMAVALFVDAFDGLLARRTQVSKVLPEIDGALLDNMVDYLNYVFVPALFLFRSDLLPAQFSLWAAALVLLASAYQFTQVDAKTEDHYFKGFPSEWNIVVFYMFLLNLNSWINLAVIVALVILVFVPIKYVYPSRTKLLLSLTMAYALLWSTLALIVLLQYPDHSPWMVWASMSFFVYYVGLSLYATYVAKTSSSI